MIFLGVLVKISPAQNKTFSREASVFHGQNFRNEIKKSIDYNFYGHNYKKPLQKKGAFKIFYWFFTDTSTFCMGTIFGIFHVYIC